MFVSLSVVLVVFELNTVRVFVHVNFVLFFIGPNQGQCELTRIEAQSSAHFQSSSSPPFLLQAVGPRTGQQHRPNSNWPRGTISSCRPFQHAYMLFTSRTGQLHLLHAGWLFFQSCVTGCLSSMTMTRPKDNDNHSSTALARDQWSLAKGQLLHHIRRPHCSTNAPCKITSVLPALAQRPSPCR